MRKGNNEPFTEFIPSLNSREIYLIEKTLSLSEIFDKTDDGKKAFLQISEHGKNLLFQISEEDINNDPIVLLKSSSKENLADKLRESIESLDQGARDCYKILTANWLLNKVINPTDSKTSRVFCKLEDIHFRYRGLSGKNRDSTLTDDQYNNYIKAINALRNCKVFFDITKDNNKVYKKAVKAGFGAFECYLINGVEWVYNSDKTKIIGLYYDLGSVGEVYTKYIYQINEKYPTKLLQLDYKNYETAKKIGNYLCYLHRCNYNSKIEISQVMFFTLLNEANYEIKRPHIQQSINRFIKQLVKASDILIKSNIIEKIDIPPDIQSKTYTYKALQIHWKY